MPLTLKRLLGAGYLPEVLPPCFASDSFGAAFTLGKIIPSEFTHAKGSSIPESSKCVRYNQARVGGMRRQFSVPNPVHFYRLANCFLANWGDIESQAKSSPISLTKPVIAVGKHCLKPSIDFRDRPPHRARVRATARYVLRCDIARFFPSIYTHSIPWAFHTKPIAKKDHSASLFGNELDRHFRNLQDKQTIGIPIGQDISRVIAEVILSRVEQQMAIKKWPVGIRCIDDYEIGFLDSSSANSFLNQLQHALADFELALNPLKTAVLPLPQLLIDRWDAELRRFELTGHRIPVSDDDDDDHDHAPNQTHGDGVVTTREQLLLFINKAIELQSQNRDEAVLRFSIKRLAHLEMDSACWGLYQDYLFHCALNQPETLRLVVSGLLKAVFIDEMSLDKKRFKIVLDAIISTAAPLGHSSDVAWALWAALLFQVRISAAAAKVLVQLPDSVVGCLSCAAHQAGLMPKSFSLPWISDLIATSDPFYGEHWLIAYEASRNGWISSPAPMDTCFTYLHGEKVRFFIEDYAGQVRRELQEFAAEKRKPSLPSLEDEDDSGSEDAFDNWWFWDTE